VKIVLFGATGNIGQRIAKEALSRGHEVAGVVRDPENSTPPDPRARLVKGDATDPASVARVVRGADVVVSAISPRPNTKSNLPAPSLAVVARGLIAGLKQAGVKRLIAVGGAGSLEVAPGKMLMDQPGFPPAYLGEATEGREALEVFRREGNDVEWTFLSPAIEIGPGERTGKFRLGGDQVLTDANGKGFITYEDYAAALVDEIEKPQHVRRRFTVSY
jgi:putative NADH-flavin reductase